MILPTTANLLISLGTNKMKTYLSVSNTFIKSNLKFNFLLLTSLLLAGCSIPKIDLNTAAASSYLLNPDTGKYCIGYEDLEKKGVCQDLIQIAFNVFDAKEIENIYQQKISGPNRPISLINIILNGDNVDYQPTKLENGLYQLPINQQTNTVWRVMKKISTPSKGIDK